MGQFLQFLRVTVASGAASPGTGGAAWWKGAKTIAHVRRLRARPWLWGGSTAPRYPSHAVRAFVRRHLLRVFAVFQLCATALPMDRFVSFLQVLLIGEPVVVEQ